MKKIIALLFVLIMCFPLNAYAAVNASANIVRNFSEIGVGQPLEVTVTVSADRVFNAVSFEVVYDSQKLSFISGENCNKTEEGKITCVVSGDSKQMLVKLQFAALHSGTAQIKVTEIYLADGMSEYPVNEVSESVAITAPSKGDLNGDEYINTTDLAIMKQVVASFEVSYIKAQADINGDSTVNTTDLATLKKWIAGIY